jgi:hypothetical protein
MKLKINLFYLIMIAGIATSSIKEGKTCSLSTLEIVSNELQLDIKECLKLEGLRLHHKTFSSKKFASEGALEGFGQLISSYSSVGYFIKNLLDFPVLENLFYHHITINAP